jgi:hypothetical protein
MKLQVIVFIGFFINMRAGTQCIAADQTPGVCLQPITHI